MIFTSIVRGLILWQVLAFIGLPTVRNSSILAEKNDEKNAIFFW